MNEVSGSFLIATLGYVARAAGPHARDTVLQAAGLAEADCPVNGEWITMATTLAVADAAATVMGDDDIGWRVGEELMRQGVETGFAQFLTETGSISAALTVMAEYGSRMSNGRHHEVVEREPGQVTIESFYDQLPAANFFCRLQGGYYASIPAAFGGTGFVSEPSCQFRGDSHCRFVVRWTGGDLGTDDIRAASRGTDAIVRQFEDMEEIAAELARAQDTEAALECIMARVGTATMAPPIPPRSPRWRVHPATSTQPRLRFERVQRTRRDASRRWRTAIPVGEGSRRRRHRDAELRCPCRIPAAGHRDLRGGAAPASCVRRPRGIGARDSTRARTSTNRS